MSNLIVSDIKRQIGIDPAITYYDPVILMTANGVFQAVRQFYEFDPENAFIATSSSTWANYFGTEPENDMLKIYVAYKVKMVIDPPTNNAASNAMEKMIEEYEWRLNLDYERKRAQKYDVNITKGTGILWVKKSQKENPVNFNEKITLTAQTETGYIFSGWYNGNTLVTTSNPYEVRVRNELNLQAKGIAG